MKKKNLGSDSQKPVFIVGMPRSGTTLLEQIIASHQYGFGAGELSEMKLITDEFGFSGDLTRQIFEKVNSLGKEEIREFAGKYLKRLERHSGDAKRIVDKMPQNQVYLWFISLLFPDAPVISCIRDPLDTCFSCFITDFHGGHAYKQDMFSVGAYYAVFSKYMELWKEVVANPILTVNYEDLTENTEKVTRQVIKHIGLDWDQNCLELRDRGHFSQTASNIQIRQGIYKTPVKRWTKYEKHLGPLKEGLEEGKRRAEEDASEELVND